MKEGDIEPRIHVGPAVALCGLETIKVPSERVAPWMFEVQLSVKYEPFRTELALGWLAADLFLAIGILNKSGEVVQRGEEECHRERFVLPNVPRFVLFLLRLRDATRGTRFRSFRPRLILSPYKNEKDEK